MLFEQRLQVLRHEQRKQPHEGRSETWQGRFRRGACNFAFSSPKRVRPQQRSCIAWMRTIVGRAQTTPALRCALSVGLDHAHLSFCLASTPLKSGAGQTPSTRAGLQHRADERSLSADLVLFSSKVSCFRLACLVYQLLRMSRNGRW